jgi:hypothetical protein
MLGTVVDVVSQEKNICLRWSSDSRKDLFYQILATTRVSVQFLFSDFIQVGSQVGNHVQRGRQVEEGRLSK